MMNKLMVGVAISALMVSGAFAQSPTAPNPSTQSNPPAAAPASPTTDKKGDKAKIDEKAAANSGSEAAGGEQKVVASQSPDQWLASTIEGTDVIGSDGEKVGDVTDILFEQDGTIKAYVISFGGFLGMGAKDVAIAPAAFEVMPGENGAAKKLKLAMNQDQIKQAQTFAKYQPPRPAATTGAASGSLGRSPAGGGTAPSGR
jgi:hypothetical protein